MNWHETHCKTLVALTGISQEQAIRLFLQHVTVTIDARLATNPTYQLAAWFAVNLLSRTFPNTDACLSGNTGLPLYPSTPPNTASASPVITLHFGGDKPTANCVSANCHDWHVVIDQAHKPDPHEAWNPVLALLTGAYAACRVANVLLAQRREQWAAFSILDFRKGTARFDWNAAFLIGNVHLAGVGAVGSAALYAMAAHGRAVGSLTLVDHEVLDSGNLRYVFSTEEDIPAPKVERAATRLRVNCPQLLVAAKQDRFEDYFERSYTANKRFSIERLLSAPDKRSTRRAFQGFLPRELWDASTGPDQVVLHHNRYSQDEACAACIYAPIPEEDTQDRHVAATLRVPLERVKSREAITSSDAVLIHEGYPHLPIEALIGRAFDSVFRQLCDAGSIVIENVRVLAPLPFISAIAGVMLYLEFVKSLSPELAEYQDYNYTQLDPRRPPNPDFRLRRPPRSGCDCQRPTIRQTFVKLWQSDDLKRYGTLASRTPTPERNDMNSS